jgi:hypothetical protein
MSETSACPHAEVVGKRWGDPISAERQAELQGYLDRWAAETDHGERKGPFDAQQGTALGVRLTGADVSWLAEQSGRDEYGRVPNLHLEGAHLGDEHLEGANLYRARLEGAYLGAAHLEGAYLVVARLERAMLFGVGLDRANLGGAHLEGANLREACLEGGDLSGVWLDSKSELTCATLDRETWLGGIQWSGVGAVYLAGIDWGRVPRLGDEQGIGVRPDAAIYEAVVHTYRQLATQLRIQGMSEVADRFSYRASVLQRRVFLHRFRIPQYLGSLFLDLISGYGYRPMRSVIAYVLVIVGFAAAYLALGGSNGQPLLWNEAIVISMTAFHGRGFFQTAFQPGDLQAAVAAIEAFIGLLIEIVLIATFTQRFFAR